MGRRGSFSETFFPCLPSTPALHLCSRSLQNRRLKMARSVSRGRKPTAAAAKKAAEASANKKNGKPSSTKAASSKAAVAAAAAESSGFSVSSLFLPVFVGAVAVYQGLQGVMPPRSDIPSHLLHHPVEYTHNLISEDTGTALKALVHEMAVFPSNIAADLKTGGFKVRHPHIGEAEPTIAVTDSAGNVTYKCEHELMVPNADRTLCYLPQRVDVGKHFIYSGGVDGQRESFQSSIQRVTSFGRYYMGKEALDTRLPDLVKNLFQEPKFLDAAKRICPKDKQELDPFQFNVIMQIPGQTVASHIDAPYFWGADRLDFPQWLLAVMVFSNLFSEKFIDQVQVVGYLSDISPKLGATEEDIAGIGGEFIYYQDNDEGRYTKESAIYLAGSCVDGSKLVHASRIYKPGVQVPKMDKDKNSELVYVGSDKWEVRVEDEVVATYPDSDLRVSIVYRARCFADAAELTKYQNYKELQGEDHMSLDFVLKTLVDNMVAKGAAVASDISMPRVDLAMKLMGFYIKYPWPSVDESPHMPYNYCLLSKKFGFLPEIC